MRPTGWRRERVVLSPRDDRHQQVAARHAARHRDGERRDTGIVGRRGHALICRTHARSPDKSHVSVPVFSSEATPYWPAMFNTPPRELTVTPPDAATVVTPAPMDAR